MYIFGYCKINIYMIYSFNLYILTYSKKKICCTLLCHNTNLQKLSKTIIKKWIWSCVRGSCCAVGSLILCSLIGVTFVEDQYNCFFEPITLSLIFIIFIHVSPIDVLGAVVHWVIPGIFWGLVRWSRISSVACYLCSAIYLTNNSPTAVIRWLVDLYSIVLWWLGFILLPDGNHQCYRFYQYNSELVLWFVNE